MGDGACPAGRRRRATPTVSLVASVAGWVFEGNVVRFLKLVSAYIGYSYDDLDEVALTGALERTDDESIESWFSYRS